MLGLTITRPQRRPDDVELVRPRRYHTADEVHGDIVAARRAVSELLTIELQWDAATRPVRNCIDDIVGEIKATHHSAQRHTPEYQTMIILNRGPEAMAQRKMLFAQWDDLRFQYAPEFKEWHLAKDAVKQGKKAIEQLEVIAASFRVPPKPLKQPVSRAHPNQGSLF